VLEGAANMTAVKATKLEAARHQLDAAIELFFTAENPIAVHTLTASAYNVLKDLAKRDGLEFPFIKSGFLDSVPQKDRSAVRAFLQNPENFFKHADHDPDGVLEFNPQLTELFLLDACSYFKHSGAPAPRHSDAIKAWGGTLRADIDPDSPLGRAATQVIAALRAAGKAQFWQWYKQLSDAKRVQPGAF
jgi:hypothetical protein